MSTTFCPMPWITQSTRNNGDLRICCQSNVGEDQGLVRKPQEDSEFYYFVRTKVMYIPDPELYIKNRLAGKKTAEVQNETFHNVKAIIKLNNRNEVLISSNFGKYNINNFDTIFSKNVIINYLQNKIKGEYFDFQLQEIQ